MAAASFSNSSNEKPAWLTTLEIDLQSTRCSRCLLDLPEFTCKKNIKHKLCRKCCGAALAAAVNGKLLCPLCRGDLLELCELVMAILHKSLPRRKCKFSKCNHLEVAVEMVEAHQNDCPHRELPCYQCNDDPIPLSGWADHLRAEHKQKRVKVQFGYYTTKFFTLQPVQTTSTLWKQKTFLFRARDAEQKSKKITFFCHLVEKDAHFLIWVAHNQSKYTKSAYKYTIILLDIRTNVRKRFVKHTAFCHPADVTVQEMAQDMDCLVVPATTMRANMDSDLTLAFKLSLNKTHQNSL